MDTSAFNETVEAFPDAELLPVAGSTCQCYRVKLYGKLHFLKRLKPELATDPRHVAALNKEFETGYRLEHPHLVRYMSKSDDGILMEYVDGDTLTSFMAANPDYFKDSDNAGRFLRQLLDVVGYLHCHQIVHLDLKPDNILITRIGHDVKLIDLGYCYTDTYSDTMGRTDRYAAPEQLDGTLDVDARTDIYAIGRILQSLSVTRDFDKIIAGCTRHDKFQRYQSVSEVLNQLNRRNPSRRWLWLLLLIPLVAGIALYLYQSLGKTPLSTSGQQDTAMTLPVDTPAAIPSPQAVEQQPTSHVVTTKAIATDEHQPAKSNSTQSLPSSIGKSADNDIQALRKELQTIAQPIFNQMLGAYRDSTINEVSQSYFSKVQTDFRDAIMQRYYPLLDKYRKAGKVSELDFYLECSETWLWYCNNLYYDMQRNAGNPAYRNKHYHYYDKN